MGPISSYTKLFVTVMTQREGPIEKVWRQNARQNVGVLDWGARSNAILEIFGVIV